MLSLRRSSRTRSRLMGRTVSSPRTRRAKPLPVQGKMLSTYFRWTRLVLWTR